MSLSAEAIKAIQEEARKAESLTKAVTILDFPGDTRHKLLVQSGTHETIDVPPTPRNHGVHSLADLIEYTKMVSAASESEAAPLVIWHAEDRVLLIIDDNDRRDQVRLELEFSAAWSRLWAINENGGASLPQKDFIRLLKNEFQVKEMTIAVFRSINFKLIQSAEGNVSVGKESMGRQIESQVKTGVDALPEEIVIGVPIYINAGEQEIYDVRLLLDYDAQAARIVVAIEADALSHASDRHQADIALRMTNALPGIPHFHGHP